MCKADVAADLVDVAVKNHLVFALWEEMQMKSRQCVLQNFNTRGQLKKHKKTIKTTERIKFPFSFRSESTRNSNNKMDIEDIEYNYIQMQTFEKEKHASKLL